MIHQIDLKYNFIDHRWNIISNDLHFEERKRLNDVLEDVHLSINLNLNQQIQLIIYLFDKYFTGFYSFFAFSFGIDLF